MCVVDIAPTHARTCTNTLQALPPSPHESYDYPIVGWLPMPPQQRSSPMPQVMVDGTPVTYFNLAADVSADRMSTDNPATGGVECGSYYWCCSYY